MRKYYLNSCFCIFIFLHKYFIEYNNETLFIAKQEKKRMCPRRTLADSLRMARAERACRWPTPIRKVRSRIFLFS